MLYRHVLYVAVSHDGSQGTPSPRTNSRTLASTRPLRRMESTKERDSWPSCVSSQLALRGSRVDGGAQAQRSRFWTQHRLVGRHRPERNRRGPPDLCQTGAKRLALYLKGLLGTPLRGHPSYRTDVVKRYRILAWCWYDCSVIPGVLIVCDKCMMVVW